MVGKSQENNALKGLVFLGIIIALGALEVPLLLALIILATVGYLMSKN